jgi:ABC-type sugar transport system ATPase subunit
MINNELINYLDETFRKAEWINARKNELSTEEFLLKINIVAHRTIFLFDRREPISKKYISVISRTINFISLDKKEEMLFYFWDLARNCEKQDQDTFASLLGVIIQSKDMFFNDYKEKMNVNVYSLDQRNYSKDMWLFLNWISLHKKF